MEKYYTKKFCNILSNDKFKLKTQPFIVPATSFKGKSKEFF
jgi:hypothetical protein